MKPVRVPLYGFPDVVLHADESSVKRHPQYQSAKSGDITAADLLVAELASQERVGELRAFLEGHAVELVPIHALESAGVNEIPAALAKRLSAWLGIPINDAIVQTNAVGHTGASGFQRLANQALFAGEVKPRHRYLIVDDFVGQGHWAYCVTRRPRRRRHRLDRQALLSQAGSRRLADPVVTREAWTGFRRVVAADIRVRLRQPYQVRSSLPRKLPGCSRHPRSTYCGRT